MRVSWHLNDVVEVRVTGDRVVYLRFDDGLSGELDLHEYMGTGPVFDPLKNDDFFRRVRLEGGTVAWPNGADIAPETLYAKLEALQKATASK